MAAPPDSDTIRTDSSGTHSPPVRDQPERDRVVTINVRLLVVSTLMLALIVGGGYAIHRMQIQRSSQSLITLANDAKQAGDLSSAVRFLTRYLQFRPDDYDEKVRLADWLQELSKDRRTKLRVTALLEDVLRNDPDRANTAALRHQVISLSLELGRPRDALSHIEILEHFGEGDAFELMLLKADCFTQLGRHAEAVLTLLKSIKMQPQSITAYVRLAETLQAQPLALPRQNDLAGRQNLIVDNELRSLFPVRRDRSIGGRSQESGTDKQTATHTSEKFAGVDTVISGIYALLVKRGQPRHKALLARCRYRTQRKEFDSAQQDVAEALRFAKNDPEVIFHAVELALARGEQAHLQFQHDEMRRHLTKADEYATAGVKLPSPANLRFYVQLARIDQLMAEFTNDVSEREQHRHAAEQHLQTGLSRLSDLRRSAKNTGIGTELVQREIDLREQQAELLANQLSNEQGLDRKKLQAYEEELAKLAALGAAPARMILFEARRSLAERNWSQALAQLLPIRRKLRNAVTARRKLDTAIALCHRQLHDLTSEIRTLDEALTVDSLWHRGRLMLARALVDRGRADEAIRHFQFLMGHRIASATLELIRLQLDQIARQSVENRDFSAVNANLDLAAQAKLDDVAITILRTQAALLKSEKPDLAQMNRMTALLDDAISKHPKNDKLLAARAWLEVHRPGVSNELRVRRALQMLDQAESLLGQRARLSVARAEIAAATPSPNHRAVLQDILKTAHQLVRSSRIRVLKSVARGFVSLKDFKRARKIWHEVAELSPGNLQCRLAAAELAIRIGDDDGLRNDLAAIRKIEGLGGPWGSYLAAHAKISAVHQSLRRRREAANVSRDRESVRDLLTAEELESVKSARRLLQHAAQQRSRWPEIPRKLGWIEALLGNHLTAYRHYRRALSLGDSSTEALVFCTHYLIEERKFDEAKTLLRIVEKRAPALFAANQVNLTDRRVTLSELRLKLEVESGDLKSVQKLLAGHANDFRQTLLLALLKFGKYESLSEQAKSRAAGRTLLRNVEKLYRDAVTMAPHVPEAWISYVSFLAKVGRNDDGTRVVAELQTSMPARLRDMTAARCYAVLGQAHKAERHFLHAVHAKLEDPAPRLAVARFYTSAGRGAKALSHLDQILDPKSSATPSQRKVAWHLKVLALASRGTYSHLQQAMQMLEPVERAPVEALRIHAAVLRRSTLNRDHRKLIRVFERIRDLDHLTPGDTFLLARLYHKNDRWKESEAVIEKLLRLHPKNPALLSWYADACLDRNKPDVGRHNRAAQLYRRLRLVEPDSLRTQILHARLAVVRQQHSEAEESLQSLLKSLRKREDAKRPVNDIAQLVSAAEWYEKAGMLNAAEEMIRAYIRLSPHEDAVVTLANFLGRQGRYSDALAICRKAEKTCKPTAVAVTAVNVVSLGQPDPSDLSLAESIVKSALTRKPESARILAAYASLLSVQGRTQEAEIRYREILKRYPDSVVVMNNLAWLLAVQKRNLGEARQLMNTAIKYGGPLSTFLDTRALVALKQGDLAAAIADLEQAQREDPSPTVFLHMAQAHLSAGRDTAAKAAFQIAMREGLKPGRLHRLDMRDFQWVRDRLKQNKTVAKTPTAAVDQE